MTAITSAAIKELRATSGAGMMDCKKALTETNGDMEEAVVWLRKKGLAAAGKKSSRTAAEGLVAVASKGSKALLVEVNSETDFVARNESFQLFVSEVASTLLAEGATDTDFLNVTMNNGKTVEASTAELVGTIGENMRVRRMASLDSSQSGFVSSYMHAAVAPGLGKIGVIAAFEAAEVTETAKAFGDQVAMHIAATAPIALSDVDVSEDVLARERDIAAAQAASEGRPEAIAEKIVQGRVAKFLKENVLLNQLFVVDDSKTVAEAIKAAAVDAGGALKLVGFVRYQLGEGIQKEAEDFAAEVSKVLS